MNKKEVSEIKKQYTPDRCAVSSICGCYVDAEKNKKMTMKETFLALEEEEMLKYMDIFRKTLSGTIGKNLLNLEFPRQEEGEGTWHEFLMKLQSSRLEDDELLEAFYDKVIEHYETDDNFLILVLHNTYDVPGKTSDGLDLSDASEEVYEHLLCSICPVSLSKGGLSYQEGVNRIGERVRDWVVQMPDMGFLFPQFNDRSSDIHGILCYTRNAAKIPQSMIEELFGCQAPLSSADQKDSFNTLVENTLGQDCRYDTVMTIHEKLNEIIEEQKDEPDPVVLTRSEVKQLLSLSGVEEDRLENFEEQYQIAAGSQPALVASNLTNTKKMEIRTGDVVVSVDPAKAALVETRDVDGRRCLVIPLDGEVEINGIHVK